MQRRKANRKSTTYTHNFIRLCPTWIPTNSQYFYQLIGKRELGSCCFLFQNVNGLPITDSSSMRTALKFIKKSNVSYLGLQETKMNTDHPDCIPQIRKPFSTNISRCKVHASSNNTFLTSSLHQHGGLLSAVTLPFSSSRSQSTSDPTSCVQSSVLSFNGVTISVFNIYIPHRRLGPQTNFTQAVNTIRLLKLGPPDLLPSTYVYNILHKLVMEAKEKNHLIIVGGDFNEEYICNPIQQTGKVTMTTAMLKLGLVIVTSSPGDVTPPTYSRGKKTLDHIWVSSSLRPLLSGYGYLPFNEGFISDHRGAFIHLRLKFVNRPSPVIHDNAN